MKKYVIGILLMISAICCAIAAGCNSAPKILDAPQNLRIENNILIWDEVENANGYAFYIELTKKEIEIKNNYVDFSSVEMYEVPFNVEVLAIGDGTNYIDSDWVKYTCILTKPFDPTYGLSYKLTEDETGYAASIPKDMSFGTELYVPDSYEGLPVKEIGDGKYDSKNSVTTSIRLPASLEKIGGSAFAHFIALRSIDIPEGVNSIEHDAFYGCTALRNINLPKELKYIGTYAFYGCMSLTGTRIPDGLETIGGFSNSGLRAISLPSSVKTVSRGAFSDCTKLEFVSLPDGCSVGTEAFQGCTSLNTVQLSGSVSIGVRAFQNCKVLKKIDCSQCSAVGYFAFENCTALTDIKFPKDPYAYTLMSFAYTGWYENQPNGYIIVNGDTLLHYKGEIPNGGIIDNFPSEIKNIAGYAFSTFDFWSWEGTNVASITIPDGVRLTGENIFHQCNQLKYVKLPNGITTIPKSTFESCANLESIVIPEGVRKIEEYAFRHCSSLAEVKFPSTLEEVGKRAFSNSLLTKLYLPDGVKTVDPFAFSGIRCTEIILPKELNSIDSYFFKDDTAIFYRGSEADKNDYLADIAYKGTWYYYVENESDLPEGGGNCWHFDGDGVTPVIWQTSNE